MAAFVPYAGKNSIVEAIFALQFVQQLNPQINDKFDALRSALITEFPSFEKTQVFQVTLGQQMSSAPQQMPTVAGFNAQHFKADGKPSKVFRGIANGLSSHFMEYEHWLDTKNEALRLFDGALKTLGIPSASNPMTAVNLRFLDRFTFDGAADAATASQLFRTSSRFVVPKIMDAENSWHSNSGWFDPPSSGNTMMHQLNLTGAIDAGKFAIIIDHNVLCTLATPLISTNQRLVGDILNSQHEANAALLRDLLNDKAVNDIGLGKPTP